MSNAKKEATHRLEDMTTQEVSLVDRAANLRTFLTLKAEDKMAKQTNQGGESTKNETDALVLPTEARNTLIEGVADALEKLTGVTQAIKESTVEDSAQVPDELPRMILEASELLKKVAEQYMTGDDNKAPALVDESSETGKLAKAFTDANQKFDAEIADIAKARVDTTEKARRMTAAREAQLKEIADAVRAFGASFGLDLTVTADAEEDTSDDVSKADLASLIQAALAPMQEAHAREVEALKTLLEAKTAKSSDELAEQLEALKKSLGGDSLPSGNSAPAEGGSPPSTKTPHQWPNDIAKAVADKKNAQKA